MTDWATISSLATAGGTLVLAAATFVAVRSAHRTASITERAMRASIRPLLVTSRFEDPTEKVGYADDHWVKVAGGRGVAEVGDDAIYLAIALRNLGNGLAVLDRWDFSGDSELNDFSPRRIVSEPPRNLDDFHRLTRDLYVPAGDLGFWQGVFRDPADPAFVAARDAITARRILTIDLLYGDHEGGQRTISRFALIPRDDGSWIASVSRHWNVDGEDPR